MDVAAGLAAHAAPLEDTPEWCRFSLPPQLYSDPIELEGTRLAFESFFSGPNMFPSLRKDIYEDDPSGHAVPVLFTFTPAGVLGAPPRPSSKSRPHHTQAARHTQAGTDL